MNEPKPAATLPARTADAGGGGSRGGRSWRVGSIAGSVAGVALIGGLGVLALRYSRPAPPAPAARPQPAAESATAASVPPAATFRPEVESRNFVVAEASGRVETWRDGAWVLVKAGDVLTKDDLVRTGIGRVLLKLSGSSEVELRDRVEIRLDSISRAGASLDLRRGKVLAHVGRRGDNVAITAAHTRTQNAEGLPARFVVTADEKGRVAVAATEGAATVEAAGKVVTVQAGSQTRAEPGRPPLDPETIPEDVFLTVSWPAGERHEDRLAVVGSASPGSQVRVNGAPAALDATGRFAATVPARNGRNPIDVEVEDAVGRSKHERREITKVSTATPGLAPVPAKLWTTP